jgi:hypothetical protein
VANWKRIASATSCNRFERAYKNNEKTVLNKVFMSFS